MKGFCEEAVASKYSTKSSTDSLDRSSKSVFSELVSSGNTFPKTSLLSDFFTSAFSIFEQHSEPSCQKKIVHSKHNGWAIALRKVMACGSIRKIHERLLGSSRTGISSSTSDIWLLGMCYKISQGESSGDATTSNGLAAFEHDFYSRILMTYRKGFDAIGNSKYTTDVNWGCMLRSSQMLVAQGLLFHRLGRSWRKVLQKPLDQEYLEILHLFGDSEASAFSIHNLLQAGKGYDLAPGSWVGPYAMCRSWETLARSCRDVTGLQHQQLPMALYIVSGDEDGERGGAPVLCVDDASRHCFEISKGELDWTPILLLVPLVLGLEKINPRYIPLLRETFTFTQSLGILGGKPGASTYIVGVQDEKAFYLDPHEVQMAVRIDRDDLDVDTSSYHCNVIRHISLETIDPSLAIGFYCRNKDDFDDFCDRASQLAHESNGAPLFTVAHTRKAKPVSHCDVLDDSDSGGFPVPMMNDAKGTEDDDWQLL